MRRSDATSDDPTWCARAAGVKKPLGSVATLGLEGGEGRSDIDMGRDPSEVFASISHVPLVEAAAVTITSFISATVRRARLKVPENSMHRRLPYGGRK